MNLWLPCPLASVRVTVTGVYDRLCFCLIRPCGCRHCTHVCGEDVLCFDSLPHGFYILRFSDCERRFAIGLNIIRCGLIKVKVDLDKWTLCISSK